MSDMGTEGQDPQEPLADAEESSAGLDGLPVEERWASPDSSLQLLVRLVNGVKGLEIGLTLHTTAGIFSGMLIGMDNYFETLAQSLLADLGAAERGEPDGIVRVALSENFEQVAGNALDPGKGAPAHFHLSHAWIISPGGPDLEVGLCRGRLTEVVAWTFGNVAR